MVPNLQNGRYSIQHQQFLLLFTVDGNLQCISIHNRQHFTRLLQLTIDDNLHYICYLYIPLCIVFSILFSILVDSFALYLLSTVDSTYIALACYTFAICSRQQSRVTFHIYCRQQFVMYLLQLSTVDSNLQLTCTCMSVLQSN